jgi:phosphatidylinositol phospholipase C delta
MWVVIFRPLNDYYINTSHNTYDSFNDFTYKLNWIYCRYLFNTQVSGDSNPEAYNRALRAGCRAVEIDCYDGDNGRPIVKHGYTFVKPCLFESIIRFIEPNLFKVSP